MLFVVTPKFCISIVLSFSWELKWPQEKLKTMLLQNLGWQTKSIMVCYGIFWSGQLLHLHKRLNTIAWRTCLNTIPCDPPFVDWPLFNGDLFACICTPHLTICRGMTSSSSHFQSAKIVLRAMVQHFRWSKNVPGLLTDHQNQYPYPIY